MSSPLIPVLQATDLAASLRFYLGLGFTADIVLATADDRPAHAMVRTPDGGSLVLMVHNERYIRPAGEPGSYLYYTIGAEEDLAGFEQTLRRKGVQIVSAIATNVWGDSGFQFADFDGHTWLVAQKSVDFDPDRLPDGWRPIDPAAL